MNRNAYNNIFKLMASNIRTAYAKCIALICLVIITSSQSLITISSTPMSIKLANNTPLYASPGIIIDFIILPALQRTQNEVQNLFTVIFSNPQLTPFRMYFSQDQKNYSSYRIVMDYHNDIPYNVFNVEFIAQDIRIGSASLTLLFNSIAGGLSNALNPDGGNDFLT